MTPPITAMAIGARNSLPSPREVLGRNGFTLHAATRAGGADSAGREALLKYILRPPLAQERLLPSKDGLVRITVKRAFSDGTVAIDIDPRYRCCRGLQRPYRTRAITRSVMPACWRRR
jgi:hypothetical protein